MLRLPLLNLASRETRRLPAMKINEMLRCGGVYGGSYLPLELQEIPMVPNKEFFVYYGDYFYGELPSIHNDKVRQGEERKFLLVKVSGYKEYILDKGEVEDELRIHNINMSGALSYSFFYGTGEVLGRFRFCCVSPYFTTTPPVPQSVIGS